MQFFNQKKRDFFLILDSNQDDGISAADVCLYGMNIVMPLMTRELLRFPSLCIHYFRTITLVSEIFPEKICTLNPDLQKNLVASLELGLGGDIGLDMVYQLCCEFIQVLCSYMVRFKKCEVPMYEAMRPFLKVRL